MSNPKNRWSEQEIKQVSAESMVDVRTIRRTLAGESVREVSRARILNAARRLKLKIPVVILSVLALFGCGSSGTNGIFGQATGGAAGAVGMAGAPAAGAAGVAGTGNDAGEFCTAGDTRQCTCIGVPGEETCSPEAAWGVCKETLGHLCCSQAGLWKGCYTDGCSVCASELMNYPHYFDNHPNCVQIDCQPVERGECNAACPEPTDFDK